MPRDVKLVNCTPHMITIFLDDGMVLDIPPSHIVARRAEHRQRFETVCVDGVEIPLTRKWYGAHESLPPEQPGVYYIVSVLTSQDSTRKDLLVPDMQVRDNGGRTLGCRTLALLGRDPTTGP